MNEKPVSQYVNLDQVRAVLLMQNNQLATISGSIPGLETALAYLRSLDAVSGDSIMSDLTDRGRLLLQMAQNATLWDALRKLHHAQDLLPFLLDFYYLDKWANVEGDLLDVIQVFARRRGR